MSLFVQSILFLIFFMQEANNLSRQCRPLPVAGSGWNCWSSNRTYHPSSECLLTSSNVSPCRMPTYRDATDMDTLLDPLQQTSYPSSPSPCWRGSLYPCWRGSLYPVGGAVFKDIIFGSYSWISFAENVVPTSAIFSTPELEGNCHSACRS